MEMDNLKKLIKSVEDQSVAINKKNSLLNHLKKGSNNLMVSSDGYHQISFNGDRKNKIKELIESFTKEDDALREPLLDKLNTVSRLIGNGE